MKPILFTYFIILFCSIVRADIRDDIGIFLINGLKSIIGNNGNNVNNVISNSNIDIKKNGDILCSYLDKEINNIEKKIIDDLNNTIPQKLNVNASKIYNEYKDLFAINEISMLNKLKNDVINSDAIPEIKNYVINCSNIDEKIDELNNINDKLFEKYKKEIIAYNNAEKERLNEIRKKQEELEKKCIPCGGVTSWGDGNVCCTGKKINARGIKTTNNGVTKCFCGTGKQCVTTQECSYGVCNKDGYCVPGDRKSAIGWQELGHSRLGN